MRMICCATLHFELPPPAPYASRHAADDNIEIDADMRILRFILPLADAYASVYMMSMLITAADRFQDAITRQILITTPLIHVITFYADCCCLRFAVAVCHADAAA